MKRKKKYFIDESFWISLLDQSRRSYGENRLKYEQLVKEGGNLFTSNLILGLAYNHFSKNLSTEIAEQFYDFVLRSYTLGDLRIEWIGKKYSKEAITIVLSDKLLGNQIDLLEASSLAICKSKRINFYLSDKKNDFLNSFPAIVVI